MTGRWKRQCNYRMLVRNLRKAAEQREASMTLPKKGTRTIEVNGRTFRWRVNLAQHPDHNVFHKVHRLTVEDVATKKIERKEFDQYDDMMSQRSSFTVSPSDVKKFILERFVEAGKR